MKTSEIGRIVSRERKRQEITQKDLSRTAKVTQSTISKIEKGRLMPRFDVGLRIFRALRFSKIAIFAVLLCLSSAAAWGKGSFGGARSGGFSSSRSSSSSFGGSRSGSAFRSSPAPIIRSAPSRSYSAPSAPAASTHTTTVIHQGGGGGGFFNGMLMGSLLSRPVAPVVVAPGGAAGMGMVAGPVSYGYTLWDYVLVTILLLAVGFGLYLVIRSALA